MQFSVRDWWARRFPGRAADNPRTLVERGIAAEEAGRLDEALECYRQAVRDDPAHAGAHFNLGLLLLGRADYAAAEGELRHALRLKDGFAEAWVALAEVQQGRGEADTALASLESAIAIQPNYVGALMNAGALLAGAGRLADAEAMHRRVISLAPDSAGAHNDFGTFLMALGRRSEAEACFRRTLALKPASAIAHSNLANALRELGRNAEAEACAREAIRLQPDLPEAHNHLGNALQAQGCASASAASLRRAIELRPQYREAHNSLGNSLKDLGRIEEAEAAYQQALALDPADRDARGNYLLALNYTCAHSRAEVHAEHLAWARRHADPLGSSTDVFPNSREPGRRLRIGYVSGDFRRHSVAYFIEPVLALHERAAFEVYCYSNVAFPDPMTARLLSRADHARDITGLADETAAHLVREDRIDLLVDLSGHTAGHRLGIFARKPAPVQVSYLGYPNTTGMQAIDWRITDVHADPTGEGDAFHSERLFRLAATFLAFQPPAEAPAVQSPPSVAAGVTTFGSFNVLAKVTPEVVRTWAGILLRVSGSRLLLKAHGLGDVESRAGVIAAFTHHGVEADRLTVLAADGSLHAHLDRYHEMDIALDPFPYNGTTTSLEALWMGVPLVTLRGDRHAARVGASVLDNLGLPELVAEDEREYADLAVRLAGDARRLAGLRAGMRARVAASPLMDRAGFMRALEGSYRAMWRQWCERSGDPVEP
ncbi:MAG: tetratricopeptide repeat protein [Betaproteobacteria bacterium]